MVVFNFFLAVHSRDKGRNKFHWSWTEQRDRGNDVLKRLWLHLEQHSGHAAAFKLEDACRFALPDIPESFLDPGCFFWIIFLRDIRNVFQVVTDAMLLFDQFAGFAHDG